MNVSEFISKIDSGEAKVLTVEAAKGLKGREIYWMYFGYKGNQNTVEEMVVGDTISEMDYQETQPMDGFKSRADYWRSYMDNRRLDEANTTLLLLNSEGKSTYICAHTKYNNFYSKPTFTCSDADREVYYLLK